jgi:acyl-CoA thioester hydrolase
LQGKFLHQRRAAFSDTDAMGVVHHANYLRFCEEARVAWMRAMGLAHDHYPQNDKVLAVLHYQVWHLKPCVFDDLIKIYLQVQRKGLKIHFQYAIHKSVKGGDDVRVAEAETLHIPVDKDLKPARPSQILLTHLEKESWTETWLSNS